jgi:hypothetical protein
MPRVNGRRRVNVFELSGQLPRFGRRNTEMSTEVQQSAATGGYMKLFALQKQTAFKD